VQGTASSPPSTVTWPSIPTASDPSPRGGGSDGAYPVGVLRVGSILADFDGTACPHDVSEKLLEEFGEPGWQELDDAVDRGEMGLRTAAHRQAAMLKGDPERMLRYAVGRFRLDPTFAPFVKWAETAGLAVAVVSDGFAFYLRSMLAAEGLEHLRVITNEMDFKESRPRLVHPNGHPVCTGCGTCKMNAAISFRERYGSVAFVGDGQSDRYGALYSDLVFATKHLATICTQDGVPFLPWETFEDVRRGVDGPDPAPGPVAPAVCPGWRVEPAG
jgi:2-hydroxy-3-keto-5-methylthiopentenyl-1-phosphate phosphatase